MLKKMDPASKDNEPIVKFSASSPMSAVRGGEFVPIGPSLHINGDIRGNADIIVHGHVEGAISLGEGLLMVSKQGQVDGDVNARVINIEGRVEGNLHANEQIIVRRSGQVRGSITAPRIALDFGCTVNGTIDMGVKDDAQTDPEATSKDENITDIKSATSSAGSGSTNAAAGKGSQR